jgi:hypothetical protein
MCCAIGYLCSANYYILTAIGLTPGAVLQKLDVHKKNGHTEQGNKTNVSRKSSTYISRRNSISHKISQYSTSATNRIQGTINRIQDTKHRRTNKTEKSTEYTETTKQENKEKLLPGIEPGPSSL